MATDSLKGALGRHWMHRAASSSSKPTEHMLRELPRPGGYAPSRAPEPIERQGREPEPVSVAPRTARVLLVLHALEASGASLHWARVLAEAFQAELDVCRVLRGVPATASLPSDQSWLDATRRLLVATRETRRWCNAVLPEAALSDRIIAGAANAVHEAALLAHQRDVDWIVMPAELEACGASAVALARAAGCPVFVARPPTTRSTLLVATNDAVDNYPILSEAAMLAEALHAPVLAFHDVGACPSKFVSQVDALTEPWARIQSERSSAGGSQRLPEIDVLLAHGSDRVETILQQARREDAEIILAGVSEISEPLADELAAAVVNRAVRSVLLVPSLDDPSADEPAISSSGERESRRASPSSPGGLGSRRGSARTNHQSRGARRRWSAG